MASESNKHLDLLETLLDAAVDAIIVIDQRGRILRFNRAAQSMFGHSAEDAVGQNVTILMPEPHRSNHDTYLQQYQQTGQAAIIGKGREEWGLRSDGEVFPMRLSVGESNLGSETHYVGIIHDLSLQRETETKIHALEQQLFHAERLVTLGELTAGIAHEINQPLTAIAAYADAGVRLQSDRRHDGGLDHVAICQRIGEQARRAARVVERLRGLVKGTNVSKSKHDVREVIRSVLTVFDHEVRQSGITIKLDFPEIMPAVFVDEIQVQQIIVNLVKNSIDSIREKTAESDAEPGKIVISVQHDDEMVKIKVLDNGAGIPDANRRKLFEPFFTSKSKGFGLGLSICRNIAALHGGNLKYETPPGEGALFVLSLPLATIG